MPEYVLIILDPFTNLPLQGVEVEAHSLTTGLIIDLQTTNPKGAASFSVSESVSFHARVSNKPTIYQVVEPAGGIGSGPFAYDYLIDRNWATIVTAGGGTEGQSFTTFHGHTFKVFSTIQGAVTDANADNESGRVYSIGVVPGLYQESISWPNSTDGNIYAGLTIIGLGTTDSHNSTGEVIWKPTSGSPIELDKTNPIAMQLENLVLQANPGTPSIDWTAGINLKGHAIQCEFINPVEMKTAGFTFSHCEFQGNFDGEDTDNILFDDCFFDGVGIDLHTSGDPVSGLTVIDCHFGGGSVPSIKLGEGKNINIVGNRFSGATLSDVIVLDNTTSLVDIHDVVIADNVFTHRPQKSGALIRMTTSANSDEIYNVSITGNVFDGVFANANTADATTAWIGITGTSARKIHSITVAHNAFGVGGSQNDFIEEEGGWSVLADFLERSTLGPNTPMGLVKYEITNGANNLIIPPSADDNGPPSSGDIGIDGNAHGLSKHTEFGNWKALYTDGSGDQQELALGAAGTFFQANGVAAAPTFAAVPFLFYIPLGSAEDGSAVTP